MNKRNSFIQEIDMQTSVQVFEYDLDDNTYLCTPEPRKFTTKKQVFSKKNGEYLAGVFPSIEHIHREERRSLTELIPLVSAFL